MALLHLTDAVLVEAVDDLLPPIRVRLPVDADSFEPARQNMNAAMSRGMGDEERKRKSGFFSQGYFAEAILTRGINSDGEEPCRCY